MKHRTQSILFKLSMPFLSVLGFASLQMTGLASPDQPLADHVIVVGVDGMSPDGIANAKTPNLDRLMKEGAWTMEARAVMPTSSSPNWASMIMGAGPEQHGITSNDWKPDKFDLPPIASAPGGIFPSIFDVVRLSKPDGDIAVFHDWGGFGRLFNRDAVSFIEDSDGPTNTMQHAVAHFGKHASVLTFIHLDHVDHTGHHYGHGTKEYYKSVEVADDLIGQLLAELDRSGAVTNTTVIVTSDHGGTGKGHGGDSLAEVEIPWIVSGPRVKPGHQIRTPVNTYDTALTVVHVLGIQPHPAWIGRPVFEAFNHERE